MIQNADITGLVLAGGQGSRMGGVDKGLQQLDERPLAWHALKRLAPQVGAVAVNANRNLAVYGSFGVPVWADDAGPGDYPGPLAGFLAGLANCTSAYLLTVPCDTPYFPPDLSARLAAAMESSGARLALAAAPDGTGKLQRQPAFCLMHVGLRESLERFMAGGGRKIGAWAQAEAAVLTPFDRPQDDPQAFLNVNTLEELEDLRRRQQPRQAG